jgi:hypothetical protein
VATRGLLAIVVLKTSTPRTLAIISSFYLEYSGWIKATESLVEIQFPIALSESSSFPISIDSGSNSLSLSISSENIIDGTNNPLEFPTHIIPTKLV